MCNDEHLAIFKPLSYQHMPHQRHTCMKFCTPICMSTGIQVSESQCMGLNSSQVRGLAR